MTGARKRQSEREDQGAGKERQSFPVPCSLFPSSFLIHGKHDGIPVIENEKPKLARGKRKITDGTFKDTAEFKESEDGKITE